MLTLRILGPDDAGLLESFLLPRMASSMILLGSSRAAGLVDAGAYLQGTYAGAFEGEALVGVVAHYGNGNAALQVRPEHAAELCAYAARASGRALAGMFGPGAQVAAVLASLGSDTKPRLHSIEGLFRLELAALQVPAQRADGSVQVRAARPADLDLVTAWRVAYCVEALDDTDTPRLREIARAGMQRWITDGQLWLAERAGQPLAMSAFNAVIAEAVQIGSVFTPPALRGRGYARASVAHSLLEARARGIASAILFTGDTNLPAQRAYAALGFERVGDYHMCFLAG